MVIALFKPASNFDPNLNIEMIFCTALKIFGVVMRLVRDFKLKSH